MVRVVSGAEPGRESRNEQRLVARFQAGEPEALGALFELHVDRVFAYARHLMDNREDAEDVTSEAFLRAFEKAATFRGECPFRGWLFGITRNLCRDRLRQPKLLMVEPGEQERLGEYGVNDPNMETSSLVRQAVSDLPEDQRLVLTLCDVEQWDAREAAEMIGKSLEATKSLLYRARRSLRTRLTELWDDAD